MRYCLLHGTYLQGIYVLFSSLKFSLYINEIDI